MQSQSQMGNPGGDRCNSGPSRRRLLAPVAARPLRLHQIQAGGPYFLRLKMLPDQMPGLPVAAASAQGSKACAPRSAAAGTAQTRTASACLRPPLCPPAPPAPLPRPDHRPRPPYQRLKHPALPALCAALGRPGPPCPRGRRQKPPQVLQQAARVPTQHPGELPRQPQGACRRHPPELQPARQLAERRPEGGQAVLRGRWRHHQGVLQEPARGRAREMPPWGSRQKRRPLLQGGWMHPGSANKPRLHSQLGWPPLSPGPGSWCDLKAEQRLAQDAMPVRLRGPRHLRVDPPAADAVKGSLAQVLLRSAWLLQEG